MEYLVFVFIKAVIGLLNSLPHRARIILIRFLLRLVSIINPSFDKVSLKNLRLVFPEKNEVEIKKILDDSRMSFTKFIVDCIRFEKLSNEWYLEHIECPFNEEYHAIRAKNNGKGILVASGHMGSIEFQAYVAPIVGRKFGFIARSFKNVLLNKWWNNRRQKLGNLVIERNGAVEKVIENINSGRDIAILIDQNLTKKHAVFVDWFGRSAATTFALGLIAVETNAPIVLSAIVSIGYEKYRVVERECEVSRILQDANLDKQQKILAVTDKVSREYQKIIQEHPSEWFWMHRRWKTVPEGVKEDFYD